MNSRNITAISGLSALGLAIFLVNPAETQDAGSFVALQAAVPGVPQNGNSHITGVMRAANFMGSGAGLSSVPWASIVGAPLALPPSGPAGGSLAGTYPNPAIGANAVGSTNIVDGAVNNVDLRNLAVTDAKVNDVDWSKITGAPTSFPPSGLAGGDLTGVFPNPLLAANSVGTTDIASLAVTNAKINDVAWGKVTGAPASFPPNGTAGGDLSGTYPNPQIAANAIGTTDLADLAVTNSKISDVAWGKVTGAPTSLPPSGVAGGDLTGMYPNPTLASLYSSLNKVSGGKLFADSFGVSVGAGPTSIGSGNFVVNDGTTGFGGMYVNTSGVGQPFYGFAHSGVFKAWHELDTLETWKLNNGGLYRLAITNTGNVGIGTTTPETRLEVVGGQTLLRWSELSAVALRVENHNNIDFSAITGTIGVSGSATSDTTETKRGVCGQTEGTQGVGIGVYGRANGAGSTNYGVYGFATGATTNYAGYFGGLLHANSVSASVKAFIIDHPLDPTNAYLTHSCVESNEYKNVYDGTITTDAKGYARVTVPDWFLALNERFRYQLTIIEDDDSSDFVMAKVSRKLKGNSFDIRTSKPRIEVSWQITGVRKDAYARAHPLQVEKPKNEHEKGYYLNPEVYGFGNEMSIHRAAMGLDK